MERIWEYDSRFVVEFDDKSRASYSKQRYGPLAEPLANLSLKENKKIWNLYTIENDTCKIFYYDQKNDKIIEFLIDKEFQPIVYEKYWQLNGNGYAVSRTNGYREYLHHRVIGNNELVDHINRIKTDNRLINLRNVSNSINALNRTVSTNNNSGITGVSWDNKEQKWRARIQFEYKEKTKYFDSFEQAVECRKQWEQEIYKQL